MKRVLIKTGGRAAEDSEALIQLAQEMKRLSGEYAFTVVHGGGAAVSAIQKTYGMEPLFIHGKRITSPLEMDLVDMGLAGLMNTYLVRLFVTQGLKAVGLSGADAGLFTAESVGDHNGKENRTGRIISSDVELIHHLESKGYLPVISSVSMDEQGLAMNINADEAALALAVALKADDLIFISDIPGILKDNIVIPSLDQHQAHQLIEDSVINGGMIPKVESSLKALNAGRGYIIIGNYNKLGDLQGLLDKQKGSRLFLSALGGL
ncbi:MAG: acetylglutamate kinase [Spirochaetaceae bacterium]|jgi:acetylglutamate kinase|nr:acetylglutamate kinase [Spirochaetaceae bacterium]